jgi:flagellar assembly factor FliW
MFYGWKHECGSAAKKGVNYAQFREKLQPRLHGVGWFDKSFNQLSGGNNMKVETYLFGSVEISPEKVINFPNGLVGFESCKNFMIAHEESETPRVSYTLQSLDDPTLALQIIDPATLGFHYELALTDAENDLLQSPAPEDVSVMLILFKSEAEGKAISPSLRAPLIINTKARVGLQKIMEKINSNITLSNLSNPV